MTLLKKLSWEATHISTIAGVIITLTLVTYLIGVPHGEGLPVRVPPLHLKSESPSALTDQTTPPVYSGQMSSPHGAPSAQPSDPHEVTVGPNGISNRYTLLNVNRKAGSSTSDHLIVTLHVESLATESLVSPFESEMLEIRGPELPPITPANSFRSPIPSGSSRTQEVTFSVPPTLNLSRATLRIHYYNYQGEIPLRLPDSKGVD